MHARMAHSIKNRKQNKPSSSSPSEKERDDRADLVKPALVSHQPAAVSQPALSQKREIKRDHGDTAHGDEQRFEAGCANVGDVSSSRS